MGPGEIGAALAFPNHPRGAATYMDKLMFKEAHLYVYPSCEVMQSQVSREIWDIRDWGSYLIFQLQYYFVEHFLASFCLTRASEPVLNTSILG